MNGRQRTPRRPWSTPSGLRRLAALALACLLAPSLLAQTAGSVMVAVSRPEDGPYVLWEGAEARVLTVLGGKAHETRLRAPFDLDLPGLGGLRLDPAPPVPESAEFPLPDRIAAVSDIHGNLDGLVALLRAHGVVDANRDWAFARGHLVVAGDVFDRGASVTESFWLLRRLEVQARAAGGRVHMLLGNHEIGALRGDERYLHPKYAQTQKQILGLDQKALYGPTSELGRWLRSRPVLLKLGPFLFAHGGPSPERLEEERNLTGFNAAFRKAIDEEGSPRLLGKASPIWYRGLIPGREAKRPDATMKEIEGILSTFGVRAIVVGHSTLQQGITAFHGGRVYGIDADLMSGGQGELWLYRNGACYRGRADGSSSPLQLAGSIR